MDLSDRHALVDGTQMPTLEALAHAALAACHGDLLEAREVVLASRDPAGIHATRVALRRMRAAAALFGRALADDSLLVLRADAKRLADACGATRDLDVFLTGSMAEAAAELAADEETGKHLRAFRAAALRLRRRRHNAVRQVLASELFSVFDARVTGLLTSHGRYAAAPGPTAQDDPARPADTALFARKMLRRRHRRLRDGLDRLKRLDAAERHALRLQVKKQRYAASFLAGLFDRKSADAYIEAAAGLQDALGLANDRIVAARVVADIRSAALPKGRLDWIAGVLTGWLAVRARGSADDARKLRTAVRRYRRAPRFWKDGEGG
jgi:CHAD domain-containing protein